jgi:hypothetical protein
MSFLTKDQILSVVDMPIKVVDVPEWGDGAQVRVSMMSGIVREKYELSCAGKNGGANTESWRARLVAATIVDEKGQLIFTEKDIIKLNKKSGSVLDYLFDEATKLNRLSDEAMEDSAKN